MRYFSSLKLLAVSSLFTSLTDCLSTNLGTVHGSRLTSRVEMKNMPVDASTIVCIDMAHTHDVPSSRRQALHSLMGFSAGLAFVSANPKVVHALDMDAFMNSQVGTEKLSHR